MTTFWFVNLCKIISAFDFYFTQAVAAHGLLQQESQKAEEIREQIKQRLIFISLKQLLLVI